MVEFNAPKLQRRRRSTAPYKGAKISEYRFRRVLMHFALDSSATDAAQATRLSINSVHAIYRKLRVFFFEVGLFRDFYEGNDPETYVSDDPTAEMALLKFHFSRNAAKRGLKSPGSEPPYHFAESCWRYDFEVLRAERDGDSVSAMMFAHLLELLRISGPIGAPPHNLLEASQAISVNRRSNGTPFWALSASNRDPLGALGFRRRDHQG